MAADSPTDVLILTPQLSRAAGGVWEYLNGLVSDGLAATDVRATLAGTVDAGSDDWQTIRGAANVIAAPASVGSRYGISRTLGRSLTTAGTFDVIHAQGLRTGIGFETLRLARRTSTPYLLTPHGMFHPQLRNARSLKKWLIDRAWDRRYIAGAACLHATSELELSIIRNAGIRQPVALVPIGVRATAFAEVERGWLSMRVPALVGKRRLLFLGILNRKKGLLRLVEAWAALGEVTKGWSLIIAGPDDAGHRAEVEARSAALHLGDAVTFLGPVWGDEKAKLLADADVFVLPTDWENFGIVVVEALAARLPVITTHGAPWADLERHGSGWWIEAGVPALTAALCDALTKTDDERRAMGERGRALVHASYAWPTIGTQMADAYRWLAGRGDRPAFVHDA